MTPTIDIRKASDGTVRLRAHIGEGSKRCYMLMEHDYVLLRFSSAEAVILHVGDYIEPEGAGRYELTAPARGEYDTATGGYSYELRFDAQYRKWANKLCKFLPHIGSNETSWTYTGTIARHAEQILTNIRALAYTRDADGNEVPLPGREAYLYRGTEDWAVEWDESVDAAKAVTIRFESVSILDAIAQVAEAFECEWWVEEGVVRFGRCRHGVTPVTLEMGRQLTAISRTDSKESYATRIYAYGSDRNLGRTYRKTVDPELYPELTANGVVRNRLLLPLVDENGQPLAGYIDAFEMTSEEEAVEATVVFEDVYPSRLSKVTTVAQSDEYTESEEADKEGNVTALTYREYIITDDLFSAANPFNRDYILDDATLEVTFQSGLLNGMTFEVELHDDSCRFQIKRDDTTKLPNEYIRPVKGDTFILHGFDIAMLSDAGTDYIAQAEAELLRRTREYVARLNTDTSTYECTVACDTALAMGDLKPGRSVNLVHPAYFAEGRVSRVLGFEIPLDLAYDNPVYHIGEKASYSRLGAIEERLDGLGDFFGEGGGATVDYAARAGEARHARLADEATDVTADSPAYDRWLRKDQADRTPYALGVGGRVTADGGVQFGAGFADGLTGHGGLIDGTGAGTLDSLSLRRWLEVPELRYNRVTVLRSVTWATPGGGVIESVVPSDATHGRLWLKLEEGEPGSLCADDICMGIWHDVTQTDADSDDGRGNFRFQGFRTCCFRITATASDGSWADYELRPVSASFPVATHPCEGMHCAAYGSFTDPTRQQSRYETTGYVRFLHGVCDWEFGEQNVAAQFGDLSNLTVGGVSMKGYSVYLDNVYMSGVIRKVELTALEMTVSLTRTLPDGTVEELAAPVETGPSDTVTLTATVRDGWSTVGADRIVWSLGRSTGDTDADAAWETVHPFAGTATLGWEDLGDAARALVTVSATVTDAEGGTRTLRRSVTLVRREPIISDAGVWAAGRTYLDGTAADAQGRLVTHDVWHNGQRWRCIVANTSDASNAPGVESACWVFVAGDDELHVTFAEPEMLASLADFKYSLTVTARWHGQDVTHLVTDADVEWERYTENAAGVERQVEDAQWTAANRHRGRGVLLTLADLGIGSDGIGATRFTATVTFRPPDGSEPMTESIAWEGI